MWNVMPSLLLIGKLKPFYISTELTALKSISKSHHKSVTNQWLSESHRAKIRPIEIDFLQGS